MTDNIVKFGNSDPDAAERNRRAIDDAVSRELSEDLLKQIDVLRGLVEDGKIRSLMFCGMGPTGESADYSYLSIGCYDQPCRTVGAIELMKFDFSANVRGDAEPLDQD